MTHLGTLGKSAPVATLGDHFYYESGASPHISTRRDIVRRTMNCLSAAVKKAASSPSVRYRPPTGASAKLTERPSFATSAPPAASPAPASSSRSGAWLGLGF